MTAQSTRQYRTQFLIFAEQVLGKIYYSSQFTKEELEAQKVKLLEVMHPLNTGPGCKIRTPGSLACIPSHASVF